MLINKIMEIPFPIPFSVISSPSHIRNAAPAVKATTEIITDVYPDSVKNPWLRNPITIARPSIKASTIERYLVYSLIFFLPSSPSFCNSSKRGIAMVRSCTIMDAVMYGVMFNAKMDILVKDPPVITSRKFNA